MAKGSGQLVSVLIVGVVLFFGYQYVQGHGGIQGLIDKLKGATAGLGGSTGAAAAPCQGKDASGAACDCASSTGNVGDVVLLPPFSVSNASNVAYATKKKAPAKTTAAKTPAAATPAAAGQCDCSGCTGAAATPAAGGGGNTWQQTPGTPACNLLGQSCPTVGAKGGTSNWCTCQAGGGGGTTAKTSTKGTTATKGKTSTKTTGASTAAGLAHAMLAGAELDYGFHEPHVGTSRNAYVPRYFSNVGYSN